MNRFLRNGLCCLLVAFAAGQVIASASAENKQRPTTPGSGQARKASDIFKDLLRDSGDYNLNWGAVEISDSQVFLPNISCDLSKKYFEVVQRPGFRMPKPDDRFLFPGDLDPIDQKGIMPWPGILGHWQNWSEGIYTNIERVQETQPDGSVLDLMIVRVYSMCTDQLLAEGSGIVKNPNLNHIVMLPSQSYNLKISAGQMAIRVMNFQAKPDSDELEIELHHVDSFTKTPTRNVMKIHRFL